MRRFFLLIASLIAIGCSDTEKLFLVSEKALPDPQELSQFATLAQFLENRLITEFLEGGYVVSRDGAGAPQHVGDSLLWSGLALGALPCAKAEEVFKAIDASTVRHGGALIRFDPLPSEYIDDPTSRDMEVGALFGLASYFQKCRDSRAKDLLDRHFAFIRSNDGRLFNGGIDSKVSINPAFSFFLNAVAHSVLGTPKPLSQDLAVFESGALMTALSVKAAKEPCYPVHLSTIQIITMAATGLPISNTTRKSFCEVTADIDMPLTDWYCGKLQAEKFLGNYELNRSEYRHQRCGAWENTEDSDFSTPALDWILLYHLANGGVVHTD